MLTLESKLILITTLLQITTAFQNINDIHFCSKNFARLFNFQNIKHNCSSKAAINLSRGLFLSLQVRKNGIESFRQEILNDM